MVEVLVSMLLASIALAMVPTALRITGRATILARDGTTAIGFAQAKVEELLARQDMLNDGDDTATSPGASTAFTRTWRVEAIPPMGEVHRLSATVQWDDGGHQITLETFAWKP